LCEKEELEKIMEEQEQMCVKYPSGIEPAAEIVRVYCPACGEEFIGTKRGAGGFIAGHQTYHEHENRLDLIVHTLGGV